MLSPIDFDHELLLQTAEIQNIGLLRHLSPEASSFQLIVADMAPKLFLRLGHLAPHVVAAFRGRWTAALLSCHVQSEPTRLVQPSAGSGAARLQRAPLPTFPLKGEGEERGGPAAKRLFAIQNRSQ